MTRKRRFTAVIAHHSLIPTLRVIVVALLPPWLGYFFAVTLFAKNLSAISVPPLDVPLSTLMVVPASAVAFVVSVVLLGKALAHTPR